MSRPSTIVDFWLNVVQKPRRGKGDVELHTLCPFLSSPEWAGIGSCNNFDKGWDTLREQILSRQIEHGIVPKGTKLAPKPESIQEWDSLSADETADVGIDLATPVVETIGSEARSRFNGHLPKVTVEVR